jgi:iron complex outermembrane recepter protein
MNSTHAPQGIAFIRPRSTTLTIALRSMLAGSGLAIAIVSPTFAQDASDDLISEVVVTGSRIRGVAPVGSAVIAIGQEEIQTSGALTTADILRDVPQITSLGINAEGSFGANSATNITRANSPNLRGIGQSATLVLFDGKRVAAAGTMGNFVDPSFLPPLALERLEVVADGASAIYGSDAIAGVVNLIPRKRFDGAEVSARYGFADDYSDYQIGGIGGFEWGSGGFVLAANRNDSEHLEQSDRPFISADRSRFGGLDTRPTACAPGTLTAGGITYALPSGAGPASLAELTPGTENRCDPSTGTWLLPAQQRDSFYASFTQDVGDSMRLWAQGFYSKRDFEAVGIRGQQHEVTGITITPTNPYRPTGLPATFTVNYDFTPELGARGTRGYGKTDQLMAGVEFNFGDWRASLSGVTANGEDYERRDLGVTTTSLRPFVNNPDPAIGLNLFGGPGNLSSAQIASIQTALFEVEGTNQLDQIEADINGELFDLPGGTVRVALGAEHRTEDLSGVSIRGLVQAPLNETQAIDRDVSAAYAEVFVPLVSAGNSIAGVRSLDLSAAIRYEDYSDFGSTDNPKFGINYSPLAGLTFRGSYGTSFRAPNLVDLDPFSSGSGFYQFPRVVPGRGAQLITAIVGGNPELEPETAQTWSIGFDIGPELVAGMRLGLTYFDIIYSGQVYDGFGILTQILTQPEYFPENVFYRDNARFDEAVQRVETSPYVTPGATDYSATTVIVDARRRNLGKTQTDGLDFQGSYSWPLGAGQLSFGATATYFLNFETSTGTSPLIDRLNTIAFPPEFRGRLTFAYGQGDFNGVASVNYLNSYTNDLSTLVTNVPSYTTVDLDLSYTVARDGDGPFSDLRVGLNFKNLLDETPPLVDYERSYDPSVASALGRVVSLSVKKSW